MFLTLLQTPNGNVYINKASPNIKDSLMVKIQGQNLYGKFFSGTIKMSQNLLHKLATYIEKL